MADYYPAITDDQLLLIEGAPLFFVATADPNLEGGKQGSGPVNLSPKGGVPLHVLDRTHVAYLDYTGSGNETARHSTAGGPMTLMICAFEQKNAAVVRLYGKATVSRLADSPLLAKLMESPATEIALPERQVIEIAIEGTVTSCGYGVPVMTYARDRKVADRGRAYKEHKTVIAK